MAGRLLTSHSIGLQQSRPPPRPQQHPPAPQPQPTPQVAGRLFTPHPTGLQQSRHQDSDIQDDQAQQSALQCLQLLSDHTSQAMVVISQLMFRKYLDNCTNPVEISAAARLPSAGALPVQLEDGECDLMIIHRQQGLIIGEIKSVGGGSYFQNLSESQQHNVIVKKVRAAVGQVNNQATALRHLVSDLNIRVTKTLILPNLMRAQLFQALTNSPVAQVSVSGSVLFTNTFNHAIINMPVAQLSVVTSVPSARLLLALTITTAVSQVSLFTTAVSQVSVHHSSVTGTYVHHTITHCFIRTQHNNSSVAKVNVCMLFFNNVSLFCVFLMFYLKKKVFACQCY